MPLSSLLFFFSSRRRHTRWPRDWSSDVCSSDLIRNLANATLERRGDTQALQCRVRQVPNLGFLACLVGPDADAGDRSEERRVGEEGRGQSVQEYKMQNNIGMDTIEQESSDRNVC